MVMVASDFEVIWGVRDEVSGSMGQLFFRKRSAAVAYAAALNATAAEHSYNRDWRVIDCTLI